ncbi:AraC family transcriptional regulator [Thalassococcus sp. S3]|uniref:helix-turn-helix domain-containing protein n=1 Tax=Thalassococcus sp. S3 TaxID=2017482 RepID=UPI0013EEE15C|nr:helix-turn-helix transcriptional regulator [Thalassococcus sp. S3]
MTQDVIFLLQGALPVIALYSAALAWSQVRIWVGFGPLGLLFLLIFLISPPPQTAALPPMILALWQIWAVPLALMIAPVFWSYIQALTAEPKGSDTRLDRADLVPAGIAACAALAAFAMPTPMWRAAFQNGEAELGLGAMLVVGTLNVMAMLTYVQWLVYGIRVYRRLVAYRQKLRDLFASTEQKELLWIHWVIGLFALNAISGLLLNLVFSIFSLVDADTVSSTIGYQITTLASTLLSLMLVAVFGVWGLRQRPGLAEARPDAAPEKYNKSALSLPDQQRIARKLNRAMHAEHLYREPDLSLWRLSDHIGVTPNYLSQTLNEHLQMSFFDYVNRSRIEEAKSHLLTSERAVTDIAYDVGFNSRSAFYTAFKRVTGQTPSAFRKASPQRTVQP